MEKTWADEMEEIGIRKDEEIGIIKGKKESIITASSQVCGSTRLDLEKDPIHRLP